jgi:hypothetical protein
MRTAHCAGESSGWAIITHPFHPRRGERFQVLKARRYYGQATLILEGGECGNFSILEDWTDKAVPTSAGAARLLSVAALLELVQLVQQLKASGGPASSNQKGVDRCA